MEYILIMDKPGLRFSNSIWKSYLELTQKTEKHILIGRFSKVLLCCRIKTVATGAQISDSRILTRF